MFVEVVKIFFVFIDFVFGVDDDFFYFVVVMLVFMNDYGWFKVFVEDVVLSVGGVVVRIFLFFGWSVDGSCGVMDYICFVCGLICFFSNEFWIFLYVVDVVIGFVEFCLEFFFESCYYFV